MRVTVGVRARREHVVGADDTAAALGSGSLPVLATPRLLAWCEGATCAALDGLLDDGATSVGVEVRLEHLAASPVGAPVVVEAGVTGVDGRRVSFMVTAHDGTDVLLARGSVERVVVDAARFLARLGG